MMATKLVLHCGRHKYAVHHMQQPAVVVGQTIETGDDLVARGRAIAQEMAEEGLEAYHVFTNNDHFLNGVRLACKDGTVDYKNVEILFYNEHGARRMYVDQNGQINDWPRGFFDATDYALTALLS